MRIGIIFMVFRREEMVIKERVGEFGEVVMFYEDDLFFFGNYDFDVVIIRNVSYFKVFYIVRFFESEGILIVNFFRFIFEVGDKLFVILRLVGKVFVFEWKVVLSEGGVLRVLDFFGYLFVLKLVFGSWGRFFVKVNDRDLLEVVLEYRKWMKNFFYGIYYF